MPTKKTQESYRKIAQERQIGLGMTFDIKGGSISISPAPGKSLKYKS